MRKVSLLGVVCLITAAILAANGSFQPLKVKTGLWQITITSTEKGAPPIPPDMQARLDQMSPEQKAKVEAMIKSRYSGTPQTTTYKKCVTAKDLNTNPFDSKCQWTILSATGTDLEAHGTSCDAGKNNNLVSEEKVKAHVIDSENAKGTVELTISGSSQTSHVNGTITGKWIGATCPAGVD